MKKISLLVLAGFIIPAFVFLWIRLSAIVPSVMERVGLNVPGAMVMDIPCSIIPGRDNAG